MNVLIIDTDIVGLDFALRCANAGHAVKWFRFARWMLSGTNKKPRDGDGFKEFQIVDDWRPHMAWAKDGLIMTTGNWRYIAELDRYRELGFKIFAPTVASARLEIDRGVGMDAMKAAGIEMPSYQTFDSFQAVENFARKSDRAWVFKPIGDETDKSLTYVSEDSADLCGFIRRQIAAGKIIKGRCMLQEKLELLCELGVSGWLGPDGFLPDRWQICFEHKKLMNGEIGPNTGEQGTVCQYVEKDKLANETLLPLEPALRALGHRGDFAIGVGIDHAGKAWAFEFTARCGWPAWWIQTASHRGDPAKWMRDLLDGKDTLRVSYDVAIGVVCTQPCYPYENSPSDATIGNPIRGIDRLDGDIHPVSVMRGKGAAMRDGRVVDEVIYQTSGDYVLCATALGKTIERAQKKVYATVEKVRFANRMYRTDIGDKVKEAIPALHRHGYARQMN